MAKQPSLPTITGSFMSSTQLNSAFRAIEDTFDNTLSRDGSTPNNMEADLDMDSNDIINVDTLYADEVVITGIGGISEAVERAETAADEAEEAADRAEVAASLLDAAVYSVTQSFTTDADEDDGRGPYELAFDPLGTENLMVFMNGGFLKPIDHFTVVPMETSASGVGIQFDDELVIPTGATVSYTLNRHLDPDLPPLPTVPENYAALGNGTGDDSTAFIAALTAANGNLVVGKPGATYRITNAIEYEGPVRMDLSACTIQVDADVPAFELSAQMTGPFLLSANYTSGDLTLAVTGLTEAPKSGQVGWIASQALDPSNRDKGSVSAKYRCGESFIVGEGSTTTSIVLTAPLRMTRGINPTSSSGDEAEVSAYTTAYGARVAWPDMDAVCDLKLGTIRTEAGHEGVWDSDTITVQAYANPRIIGGHIEKSYGSGLKLAGTYGALVDGLSVSMQDQDDGYAVADSGAYTRVRGLQANNVRHAYTTNKATTSWPPSEPANLFSFGRCYGAVIEGGVATGGLQTHWDTHADAEDVTFIANRSVSGGGAGFAIRGKGVHLVSPLVRGSLQGVHYFTEYNSGDADDDIYNNGKAEQDWTFGSVVDADVECLEDCVLWRNAFGDIGGSGRWVSASRLAINCQAGIVSLSGKQKFIVGNENGTENPLSLIRVTDAVSFAKPVFDNPEVVIEGFVQIDATAAAGLDYALQCESDDCRVTVTGHLHLILPSTITAILSTLGTIKTLGHGIITYEVVGAADNTVDLGLNGRSIRIVSSDGTVNTTPYKHVIRALSPFEFGAITYVDDTEVIRDCLEYATTNWLPVSFVGMQAICAQGDGEITFHCPHLDWAGVPFEGVDALKAGTSFTLSDFITAFVIADPDCDLVETTATVGSDILADELRYGSQYPLLTYLPDFRGYASIESGGDVVYGGKAVSGSFTGVGTLEYIQPFKISRSGITNHPLSADLSGDTTVTVKRRADSERGQMRITGIVGDVSTFNNQCILRIERNNIVIDGVSLIGVLPDYNRNALLRTQNCCDVTFDNVGPWAMDLTTDPDENKSSRMFNAYGCSEVRILNSVLLGGWGAIGSSDISGLHVKNCTINRVDVHGRGGNIFVTDCNIQELGVYYGCGFGEIVVTGGTYTNTKGLIYHRPDFPGGWFGGAWTVQNIRITNDTYDFSIVDCWTNPIGSENAVEELPWIINVQNAMRLPRVDVDSLDTAPDPTLATLTRAIDIKVAADAVNVVAPMSFVVDGMTGTQRARFAAMRVALLDMRPQDTGIRSKATISNVAALYEGSSAAASTIYIPTAIKTVPAVGVDVDFTIADCQMLGIEAPDCDDNTYTIADCAICRVNSGDERVAITGGSLAVPVMLGAETTVPIGGAIVDETDMTTLEGVRVFEGADPWDLSQVGALHGVLIASTDATTVLPSGVTASMAYRGWTPRWDEISMYLRVNSDRTLTSTTSAQKIFDVGTNGGLTLPVGFYEFDAKVYLSSMSGTSGNAGLSIKGAGTATVNKVLQGAIGRDANTATAVGSTSGSGADTEAITGPVVTAAANTGMFTWWTGFFQVSVAGTIIPSIALDTAATPTMEAGTYFVCRKLGTSASSNGPVA
jgi:hypothetical protein